MAQIVRKPVAPYYAVAAVWILYALCFDLYKVSQFFIAGILSLIVGLLVRAFCKDRVEEVPEKTVKAKPAEEKSTGDPQLDKMLKDGRLALEEMKRLDENIEDEKISQQIRRLETVCQKIFQQVKENPSKLPQIRKFMDYYLPTTLKLLNAYDRMGSQGIQGENISGTLQRVEEMMGTIVQAFEKQLDGLFGSEAMDISTDITVLENMMAREGLTQQPLQADGGNAAATAQETKLEL